MALYNKGSSLMGTRSAFAKGASLVIRAMLQSPYFLFRTELGAKGAPLNGYEMAAKLSLWLRGTSPDDKTARFGGRPRQAGHRRRRGGAGHHDAGRGDGDQR